jgi:hypothetical protein
MRHITPTYAKRNADMSCIDPYGSTEATRVDGEGVSAVLTWDSKVLTVVSIIGGIGDLVREKLQADGLYNEFIRIAEVSFLHLVCCTNRSRIANPNHLARVLYGL